MPPKQPPPLPDDLLDEASSLGAKAIANAKQHKTNRKLKAAANRTKRKVKLRNR